MIEVEQIGAVIKFRMARTIIGREIYYTAAYWVDGLMIDTGCLYTIHELLSASRNLSIDLIVNTHSHEDHVAGNAALQTFSGASVKAHPEALPVLSNPHIKRLRTYQKVMWGSPPPSHGEPIGETIQTKQHRFEIIHTPGHSADHISLYEPEQGWLFCGDAYVGGRDRSLRADYDIWRIITSLKKMASLNTTMLFPGSGNVRPHPKNELMSKIEYLENRGQKVLELAKRGWSRRKIRRKLFGPEMPIAYYTLGHFSGKNLVRSYIEDQSRAVDEEPLPDLATRPQ